MASGSSAMPAKKTTAHCLPEAGAKADLDFPGAGRFLLRVLSRIVKAVEDEGGEIVARLEVNGASATPCYRLERPNGKLLLTINGTSHRELSNAALLKTERSWRSTTVTSTEVYEAGVELVSDEIRAVIASRPVGRKSKASRRTP